MSTPAGVKRGGAIIVAALAVLLALAPNRSSAAVPAQTVPTSAIMDVSAIGLTSSQGPVYVASAFGLYRSASPTFSVWTRQSTHPIYALSVNPSNPNDLLYLSLAPQQAGYPVYRSTDGGRTATGVGLSAIALARAPGAPSTIYASDQSVGYFAISKTVDDGLSWTTVITQFNGYGFDSEGFNHLAIDPKDPNHVLASLSGAHGFGFLYETHDGGRTWHETKAGGRMGMPVSALAFNPRRADDFWVGWGGLSNGGELDHNLTPVPNPYFRDRMSITNVQLDPLTGRVYVYASPFPETDPSLPHDGIYASNDGGTHFEPVAWHGVGAQIALTQNGYLLTGDSSTTGASDVPLVVLPLNGPDTWDVVPELAGYAATVGGRELGLPISPRSLCGGAVCQYFENGALVAQRGGHYAYGSLVPPLMKAGAALPIGGTGSSVTYKSLAVLHRQLVSPPSGFHGGTRSVLGGTFVPYSAHLAAVPGYIVPPYFWTYLTNPHTTPGGWVHDIGLPLTNAMTTTLSVGTRGAHTVVIQAFERAILTYTSLAPRGRQVARAPVGSDFATVFPQDVR